MTLRRKLGARNSDGSRNYCDAEGPQASTYGGKKPIVRCMEFAGHEGDHRNGSWAWPQPTEEA